MVAPFVAARVGTIRSPKISLERTKGSSREAL
jgi:hypothetical protein